MRLLERPRQPKDRTFCVPEDHKVCWDYIQAYLKQSNVSADQEAIDAAMAVLPRELVISSYIELIRTTFLLKIVPALNAVVPSVVNLQHTCDNLRNGLVRYQNVFSRLRTPGDDVVRAFKALVKSHFQLTQWQPVIKEWLKLHKEDEQGLIDLYDAICTIGLQAPFESAYKDVLCDILVKEIRFGFAKKWEQSCIHAVSDYAADRPRSLINLISLDIAQSEVIGLARDTLARLRIEELFDIVVQFPDSVPALEDLKQCLTNTEIRAHLVTTFNESTAKRLLQPGANTLDIITIYISTIKALLVIDPVGVLLDRVARPIRKYLRDRPDTIRSILSSLLGEVDNDLAQELQQSIPEDDVLDEDDPNWEPDPIDAAPDYMKNKASDIIGSLITIYENKDVFVRELQTLLADRLLAITDYNVDHELRNLEMLKLRFGETTMSVCDVMLKDMGDSRRIDSQIHADAGKDGILHTTILSRLYWPNIKQIQESSLKLPIVLEQTLEDYADGFSRLKAQRMIKYQKDMGHVRVYLELEDRTFDMLVSPVHAATIDLFNENTESLSLETCSTRLNIPPQETRRSLNFWVAQQILCMKSSESIITYSVLETLPPVGAQQAAQTVAPLLGALATQDPAAEMEPMEADDMSMYWQFIIGMLTNVGPLPSDRIQSMLGMFAPSYDKTGEQLTIFLTKKVRQGELDLKGGIYKLS